jgi:hypothetical protein
MENYVLQLIFNLNEFAIKYRFDWEYLTVRASLLRWGVKRSKALFADEHFADIFF